MIGDRANFGNGNEEYELFRIKSIWIIRRRESN